MICIETDKFDRIISAVDTKRIVGFVYDGTSPEHDPRYILKLDWGHTLMVGSVAMQQILSAMMNEAGEQDERKT